MAVLYKVATICSPFDEHLIFSVTSEPHIPTLLSFVGWSGGAMVLGKLPAPGRPTFLGYSRARAYCACSRCGWGLFVCFSLIYHFSSVSLSLGDGPI